MNDKNLIKSRNRIAHLLISYARRGLNAGILVDEFDRLENEIEKNGGKRFPKRDCFTKEYWDNPIHTQNEHKNKNPLLKVSNGVVIWKNWQPNQAAPQPKKQVKIAEPQVHLNQPIHNISNYYILNVVGLDKFIDSTEVFIRDLGCKCVEHNYTSIVWQYEGTEKEFSIIRRSVTGLIDTLIPHNSIQVYGKKISQKIV